MTLTGYWPLNEESGKARDYSGNENHGEVSGGLSQGSTGVLGGNSYSFDGSDGYVRHDYTTSPSFTVTLWMKSNTSTWSASGTGWSDRSANGFILHPQDDDTTWSGYVLRDGFNDYFKIDELDVDDITKWHMYTITHDNEQDISKMFLDGREVAESSTTTDRRKVSNKATLGHDDLDNYDVGERPLNGKISEARHYRRPLTAREVYYLYAAGSRGLHTSIKKNS